MRGRPHFKNVRVKEDGITFGSRAEYARYAVLKTRAENGEILGLEVHPRFPLVVNGVKICTYVADFRYDDGLTQERVVEDVKGVAKEVYVIKKKLMLAILGIEIVEVK
jgi:hypothetical protein